MQLTEGAFSWRGKQLECAADSTNGAGIKNAGTLVPPLGFAL